MPPESDDHIQALFETAVVSLADDPQQALQIADQACQIAEQIHGENSSDYARAVNNLGLISFGAASSFDDLEQCMRIFFRAVTLEEGAGGENSWRKAVILVNLTEVYLATIYRLFDQYQSYHLPLFEAAELTLDTAWQIVHALSKEQSEPYLTLNTGYMYGPGSQFGITFTIPEPLDNPTEEEDQDISLSSTEMNSDPELQGAIAYHNLTQVIERQLHNLGNLFFQVGDFQRALVQFDNSVKIKQRLYLLDVDPLMLSSRVELAWMHYQGGDYPVAREMMLRNLRDQEQINNQPKMQVNVIDEHGESLPVNQETDPEEGFPPLLNDLASLEEASGNRAAAIRLARQALAIAQRQSGQQNLLVARCLNYIGWLYQSIGDSQRALDAYRHSLYTLELLQAADSKEAALIHRRVAMHALEQDNLKEAEEHSSLAVSILSATLNPEHPEVADLRGLLGRIYLRQGSLDAAQEEFTQACESLRKVFGDNHQIVAGALLDLGTLWLARGDFARAEEIFKEALEIDRKALGDVHFSTAHSFGSLARLYALAGESYFEQALAAFDQVARIQDAAMEQIFAIADERQRSAHLYDIQGAYYALLTLISKNLAHEKHYAAIRQAFELVLRRKGLGLEALAAQRGAFSPDAPQEEASRFNELLLLRQQIGMKLLTGPGDEGAQASEALLQKWQDRREQLEIELANWLPVRWATKRTPETTSIQSVAASLPPGSALIEYVSFCPARFLPTPGEPAWEAPRCLAFILPAGAPEGLVLIDLGDFARLEQSLNAWRQAIEGGTKGRGASEQSPGSSPRPDFDPYDPRSMLWPVARAGGSGSETAPGQTFDWSQYGLSVRETGLELRRLVFEPLLPALGDIRRLFIAPDGELSRLPFAALPLDNGGYLLDEWEISYLGCGRDLPALASAPVYSPGPALVVAAPDYDLHIRPEPVTGSGRFFFSGQPFAPLPWTGDEGRRIADALGVQLVTGDQALEATIKASRSPYVLHIASHGYFLETPASDVAPDAGVTDDRFTRLVNLEDPLLRSGLALAGANAWAQGFELPVEAQDGLLTGEDVLALELSGSRLVVLSACQTGLGQSQAGEGVFGLSRAFTLAGARALVLSLWRVPDLQTSELMVSFYHSLLTGKPLTTALREAILNLRKDFPLRPDLWGGFVCYGHPGPLQ